MLHSRNLNKKINRLHKRCLLIIFNDKITSFEQLLDNDNSVSIHHRNTQALAIEMYKVTNWLATQILNNYTLYIAIYNFTNSQNLFHTQVLKYANLVHPLSGRLTLRLWQASNW